MATKDKFPEVDQIAWGKIKEVRVSSDKGKGSYSFEFDLHGKKQMMTITISPKSTAFTISDNNGNPIVHATQTGSTISLLDFSKKVGLKGPSRKLRGLKPVKKR